MLRAMSDEALPAIDPKWGEPGPMHDPYVLAHFRPRPTDVLITTAPKCGTTWMQQILHQLRTGGDPSFASLYEVVPWLEANKDRRPFRDVVADFERLPDPRVFKTHCTYDQTPGTDVARIILTTRDPRDAFVSMLHHMRDMTDEAFAKMGGRPPTDVDSAFERWMQRRAWFRNIVSWWPHRDDPNVLLLRYEDLLRDLPGAIDQIVDHLGWDVGRDARARAAEYSSFAWMSANREKFTRFSATEASHFKPGGFIRKGAAGDHAGVLSAAQEQRLLDEVRRSVEPECLAFLGLA
jgi:hypothetical protein